MTHLLGFVVLSLIVATLEDLKKSRIVAKEKGWEMYANDLEDQITGMEKVLSELNLPARGATTQSQGPAIKVKRNTQAIVQLAAEKSRASRLRVVAAISTMQSQGSPINFNTVCHAARVSKTFLYDPKHSDLAQQIRSLRHSNPQPSTSTRTNSNKSDSAKDAQIARFKERIRFLEEQVRALQAENELLYGKLTAASSEIRRVQSAGLTTG